MKDFFDELEKSIISALETYSNVHRGSGLFSAVTTMLYEESRNIVLDFLGLKRNRHVVIFCSPLRANDLVKLLKPGSYRVVSSEQTGINTGVVAVAAVKKELPGDMPFQAGGGTTRLVSHDRIAWAEIPDRYEAGTPQIINAIALAKSLQLIMRYGTGVFLPGNEKQLSVQEILHSGTYDKLAGERLLSELANSVIGRNTKIPVQGGASQYINLDYAASTPAIYPAWESFRKALRQSQAPDAQLVRAVKHIISAFLNAPEDRYDITFTSNTTEAINIVSSGIRNEGGNNDRAIMLSLLEHNSNDLPWRINGFNSIVRLNVDGEGFIDNAELERTLVEYNEQGTDKISLMAVSGASNVLGSCNDLESIGKIVHKHGASFLVDAAQLIAHRKTDIEKCGIDFLVFSGHKAYAPFGTGVLISAKGMLHYEDERWNEIASSGEQNVAGIAALGKSLLLLQAAGMDLIRDEEQVLLKKTLKSMSEVKDIQIYGISDPGSPRISLKGAVISFSMKKIWPDKLSALLSREGIGTRYGCHCAHLLVKHLLNVGPFLERFQFVIAGLFSGIKFPGVVRISFGIGTTEKDIDDFISVLKKISPLSKAIRDPNFRKESDEFTISARDKVFRFAEDKI